MMFRYPAWLHKKKNIKPARYIRCPRCGHMNEYKTNKPKYCRVCKQELEWTQKMK